jgi:hypothetical protein
VIPTFESPIVSLSDDKDATMLRLAGSILFFLCVLIFVTSCSDVETNRNSLEYFEKHLQKEMTHDKAMILFGKPDKDLGSGIHIYVYQLKDSTEIWIGITDKLIYANHVDQDRNILKVLI